MLKITVEKTTTEQIAGSISGGVHSLLKFWKFWSEPLPALYR